MPVDGDTFDLPAMIATGELRRTLHGQPEPKAGHRVKFGTPEQHRDFSAVTHVAPNKGIPPFLIFHVAGREDSREQSEALANALTGAGGRAQVIPAPGDSHRDINVEFGQAGDPEGERAAAFVAGLR